MHKQILAAAFVGLFFVPVLGACAATVENVTDHPIVASGAKLSLEDVRKNIMLAGLKRHWHMTDSGTNQLTAVQENPKRTATININFTTTSYSITLVSSIGLDQSGDRISGRYNGWVRYLTQDIDDQLSKVGIVGQ